MKRKIETVLFDAGGTLVGADDLFQNLINEFNNPDITIKILGEEFSKLKSGEPFHNVKGLLKNVCKSLASKYGVKDLSEKACSMYIHTYTETVYLYPSVLDTLKYLKIMGIKLLLVSDADADVLNPQFDTLGISDFFPERIISSEVGAYKPSDETIQAITSQFDFDKETAIFVGDSTDDVQTAKKLGVTSVFISPTNKGADFLIKNIDELLPLMKNEFVLQENSNL